MARRTVDESNGNTRAKRTRGGTPETGRLDGEVSAGRALVFGCWVGTDGAARSSADGGVGIGAAIVPAPCGRS